MENSFTAVYEKLDDWYIGYSSSHSDAVQHYIAGCRGTAVPCPYGCTSHKREPLYVQELPGANVQERTLEEARESLREAIELILISNRELAEQQLSGF